MFRFFEKTVFELPIADAVIAATAIVMSCEYVLTDDKYIKQIKKLK